eukprot:TRINITY_DN43774_c0_g1_i1.p1 TRINITY_DN43774_c0_g1~~TRINITY_DN43774_c0_g1_i1.p1  ORF type:complete len:162 (-),score=36.13 TRINITY_DN43774_c0_g1_i1:89-523(-)
MASASGSTKLEKALLPAAGLGAAGWMVGAVTLSTLGLVGIGAAGGYAVGNWALENFQKQQRQKAVDKLSPALKIALERWQNFQDQRIAGRKPSQVESQALFAEFAQAQPSDAQLIQSFVFSQGVSTARGGSGPQVVPLTGAQNV